MAKHRGEGSGTAGTFRSVVSRRGIADGLRSFSAVHLLLLWAAVVSVTALVGLVITFSHSLGDPVQDLAGRLMMIARHGIALILPYGAGLGIYHGVQHVSARTGLPSRMWGCVIALLAVTPFAAAVGISFYAWSISASDWTGARRLNALCDPLIIISTLMVAAVTVVLLAMNSEQEARRSAARQRGGERPDPMDRVIR